MRGKLLALAGQSPRLCDEVSGLWGDGDGRLRPPAPIGASLELPGERFALSWSPGSTQISMALMILTGTVSNGKLFAANRHDENAAS